MKKIYTIIATALCMMACSSENKEVPTPQPEPEISQIPINIMLNDWTRATDTSFENGDKVGIYVVNNPEKFVTKGNHADNVKYNYTGVWNPEKPIYWKDKTTTADFYCYHPYTSAIEDITKLRISVKEDQSTLPAYKSSEFLYGKVKNIAPSTNPVKINVKHMMSNLYIYLKPGKGYKTEELKSAIVKIRGLKTEATANLATGKLTPTGSAAEITPLEEDGHFRAMIVPQSINDVKLVYVKIGDREYNLTKSMTFTPGKKHKCTITVNKTGSGVNIDIDDWEEDEEDYGGEVE